MGKRKARKALKPTKKVLKIESAEFKCLFCTAGGNCVDVKIQTVSNKLIGTINCWSCKTVYVTGANRLTEPVDVYHEWLDECERVNPPKVSAN